MKPLLLLLLPAVALAGEPAYDCAGQTRFVHRGAQSTTPADERRSYRIDAGGFEGLACQIDERQISCHGLTPQQAYRRLLIDRSSGKVSDTLELPTSMMIFEGNCK